MSDKFVEFVRGFCQLNLAALKREQANIEERGGIRYPLMKLVDMYFWQTGDEEERRKREAKVLLKQTS